MADDVLSGTLADVPLDAVLKNLADHQRTGVLRVGEGSEIWLHQGAIYHVATPRGADTASVLFGGVGGSLGEINAMLRQSDDVAEVLAERNPDAVPALSRLLHEHNLDQLFQLLVPSEAPFRFDEGERHPIGHRFTESVETLVAQGRRRLQIWSEIASKIPSTDACFRLAPKLPDSADERVMTADEWRYLSLLDGRRSVADVITETKTGAFRVCSTLYRLLLEGLIEEVSKSDG